MARGITRDREMVSKTIADLPSPSSPSWRPPAQRATSAISLYLRWHIVGNSGSVAWDGNTSTFKITCEAQAYISALSVWSHIQVAFTFDPRAEDGFDAEADRLKKSISDFKEWVESTRKSAC